jgi:multiple sugar transport system substrate-binding protein
MWMQNAGDDMVRQRQMMAALTDEFERETGIKVDVNIHNWTEASRIWMLTSTGGDHPDVGDMFWAWSNIQIGGGRHGPMPLDQYKAQLHHERFVPAALADVTFRGSVYGIPWRIDVRPMLYRIDLFRQAGIAGPPDTWDDLVTYGRRLTTRAADGRIDISGIIIGHGVRNDSQDFMHWIWQGGGEAMCPEGMTALLNTREVINSMQFVRDLLHTHQVITMDILDPTYDGSALWNAGRGAIRPMGGSGTMDIPPDLLPNIRPAIPTMGVRRTSYSGAGYFGVLHGSRMVEESVQWLSFLSRDSSQLQLAKMSMQFSPSRGAIADDYFAGDEWTRIVAQCLEFAKTSQQPSAAWSQIAGRAPGSPIYDFWADTLLNREPLPVLAERYNAQAQLMMDRAR